MIVGCISSESRTSSGSPFQEPRFRKRSGFLLYQPEKSAQPPSAEPCMHGEAQVLLPASRGLFSRPHSLGSERPCKSGLACHDGCGLHSDRKRVMRDANRVLQTGIWRKTSPFAERCREVNFLRLLKKNLRKLFKTTSLRDGVSRFV